MPQSNNARLIDEAKIEAALQSAALADELLQTANAIRSAAEKSNNEATIAFEFDSRIRRVMTHMIGTEYSPLKEEPADRVRLATPATRGRIDSRIGNVIVEFKKPSTYKTAAQKASAGDQLTEYLRGISLNEGQRAVGFVTDGIEIQRITTENDSVERGSLRALSGVILMEYVQTILGMRQSALTSRNLVASFQDSDGPLVALARVLFRQLTETPAGRTEMLHDEWRVLFNLAHDDSSQQSAIQRRRESLSKLLSVSITEDDRPREYAALFAVQTAYAITVKLIAFKVLLGMREDHPLREFAELANQPSDSMRLTLDQIEDGREFREAGVANLLESDFFSWYTHSEQWTSDSHLAISSVLNELATYESTVARIASQDAVQDLFKDLYMAVIPDAVRHSLGEFYTPAWLADRTINSALESIPVDQEWTALDPCCGSGTFITSLIQRIVRSSPDVDPSELADSIRRRVVGIDLNPLAVLTARVNYFVNISPLLDRDPDIEIPIYLGDASHLPSPVELGGVKCVTHSLQTAKRDLSLSLPVSALDNPGSFSNAMSDVELYTRARNPSAVTARLLDICAESDRVPEVEAAIRTFSEALVDLEAQAWNGIWPRIMANFMMTAHLPRFDIVVGNPPWIDWKNLPENYRASLIHVGIERHLFSGDRVTGGVNLNVCALIANVASEKWLKPGGTLSFLMPEALIHQQTYEGFREFQVSTGRLYFQKFIDWTSAGNPFYPVQQPFFGYVVSDTEQDYGLGVPVEVLELIRDPRRRRVSEQFRSVAQFSEIEHEFKISVRTAITPEKGLSYFAISDSPVEAASFRSLAGTTSYRGREGLELYPQELFLQELVPDTIKTSGGVTTASFKNFQGSKSKYKLPESTRRLETSLMRPLVKGTSVERFHVTPTKYFVPFTYEPATANGRAPIPETELIDRAPLLAHYFQSVKKVFDSGTKYNARIIGARHNTAFYSVARVGEYSHAPVHVVFRDNTKWQAAVVESLEVPWGGAALPVFQNHAVSISEGPSGDITSTEAHYLCAVLNAPISQKFMDRSNDSRSFKVRLRIAVPPYDSENPTHASLADCSRRAHLVWDQPAVVAQIDREIDSLLIAMLTR